MTVPLGVTVTNVVLAILMAALLLAFLRLVRGPSLPDRVVALELISFLTTGVIATYAIVTDQHVFLDVAITLALITFLATVAFARYLEKSIR
jgi:multicomponent Na+:H+ antiporter subunit F